ncbi:hypothetical protein BDR22DRAFT_870065 [Usnea florida]
MRLRPRSHRSLYSQRLIRSCQTGTSTSIVDRLSALVERSSLVLVTRRLADGSIWMYFEICPCRNCPLLFFGERAALPNTPVESAILVPRDRTCDMGVLQCRSLNMCLILAVATLNSTIGPYVLCPDHDRVGFVPSSDSHCLRRIDSRPRLRIMTGLGSARTAISS